MVFHMLLYNGIPYVAVGLELRKRLRLKAYKLSIVQHLCAMLRVPHCLDNGLTNGFEFVSLMGGPRSTPQKHYFSASGTYFC
jgi:hypothetical protein